MKKKILALTLCTLTFVCAILVFSSCGVEEKSIYEFANDEISNPSFLAKEQISFTYSGEPFVDVGENGFLVTKEADTNNFKDIYRIYSVYTGTEIKSFEINNFAEDDEVSNIYFKDIEIDERKCISVLTTCEAADGIIYIFDTDGNAVFEQETDLDYYTFVYSSSNPFPSKGENHFTFDGKLYRIENNKAVLVCDTSKASISPSDAKYINGKYVVQNDRQVLIFDSKLRFEKAFTVAFDSASSSLFPLESGNIIVIESALCDESSKKYDMIVNNTILGGTIKTKLTTKLLSICDLTFQEIDNYEYNLMSVIDSDEKFSVPDGKTLVLARRIEDKRVTGNILLLLLNENGEVEAEVKMPEGFNSIERLNDGKFLVEFDYGKQIVNSNGDIVYNLGNDSGEYLGAGFVLIDGDVINSNGDTVISKDSYEQIKPYYNGCMIVTKFVEGQGVQHYFWNKGTETQLTGDSVTTYDWGYAVSSTDSDYNEVITYYNIEGGEIKSVVDDIDTSVSTRFYEDCLVIFVTENEVTTAYSYKN